MPDPQQLIKNLNLLRHPEGGWYRETYRSNELIPAHALPERFSADRCFSTAIYFLLESGDISALHRIRSDEVWHFYAGAPLMIHRFDPDGVYSHALLGHNPENGGQFQITVPAGCWFGAEPVGEGFGLAGCTVAPGFDFADFEMADRQELLSRYPGHEVIIRRLTRDG